MLFNYVIELSLYYDLFTYLRYFSSIFILLMIINYFIVALLS